jgi:uncharacterized protein (DUF433 family)
LSPVYDGFMADQPRIRDTQIRVWEVYRDLVVQGMSDDDVLQKYRELVRDDLTAARESIAVSIRARTHDEITGRPLIPKDRLVHGRYYKGRCRHATVARWNADEQCFYHWREKIDHTYIETIKYPTDEQEPWWDVFDVAEELPDCRFEILFDMDATFTGNGYDLNEHHEEMWRKVKNGEARPEL